MSTLNGGPGNMVTNGLVLYLDAANRDSYVSGSTTWRDLSGNNLSGSLINGPTFDNGNAGSIVFDGIDDHGTIDISSQEYYPKTYCFWVKHLNTNNGVLIGNDGSFSYTGLSILNSKYIIYLTNTNFRYSNNNIIPNTWTYITAVIGSKDAKDCFIYVNSILDTESAQRTGDSYLISKITIGARATGTSLFTNIQIANLKLYNRALTQTEILQNYNSTKARFGLT